MEKAAKAKSSTNTFDALADELLERKRAEGKAPATYGKVEWLLSLARANLGTRPIAEIAAPEALRVLKAVEARGRLETAKRLRATIGQVFRFADFWDERVRMMEWWCDRCHQMQTGGVVVRFRA